MDNRDVIQIKIKILVYSEVKFKLMGFRNYIFFVLDYFFGDGRHIMTAIVIVDKCILLAN